MKENHQFMRDFHAMYLSLMEKRGIKRADKLMKLAEALQCSPNDLLG